MRFLDFIRQQGYRPYKGAVSASVYSYFQCPCPGKAQWHFKPGSYQCAGCSMQCETDSPDGFQTFLTVEHRHA